MSTKLQPSVTMPANLTLSKTALDPSILADQACSGCLRTPVTTIATVTAGREGGFSAWLCERCASDFI